MHIRRPITILTVRGELGAYTQTGGAWSSTPRAHHGEGAKRGAIDVDDADFLGCASILERAHPAQLCLARGVAISVIDPVQSVLDWAIDITGPIKWPPVHADRAEMLVPGLSRRRACEPTGPIVLTFRSSEITQFHFSDIRTRTSAHEPQSRSSTRPHHRLRQRVGAAVDALARPQPHAALVGPGHGRRLTTGQASNSAFRRSAGAAAAFGIEHRCWGELASRVSSLKKGVTTSTRSAAHRDAIGGVAGGSRRGTRIETVVRSAHSCAL